MRQLAYPWLGVAVPCALIGGIGYGAHWWVLRHHTLPAEQWWFQAALSLVWVAYLLAIVVKPGSPPAGTPPPSDGWLRWCAKCKLHKPARAHHCKTCGVCVLRMDHHCPWTYNCVGHRNHAHFVRFLLWVDGTCGYVLYQLGRRVVVYWHDRHLPGYLYSRLEVVAVVVLVPVDFLVLVSVGVLTIRTLWHALDGMTQLEVWEYERVESQLASGRVWQAIAGNYMRRFGKPMPRMVSWSSSGEYTVRPGHDKDDVRNRVDARFCIDDLVFPYDYGVWGNLTAAFGPWYTWVLPWGGPSTSGLAFGTSADFADDPLGLPWPPDAGDDEVVLATGSAAGFAAGSATGSATGSAAGAATARRDPRESLPRSQWYNLLGETLGDFGVEE